MGMGDGRSHDDITWVGIGLAIFSNGLISVSLNVQKYAHNKNEALGDARKPYHHIPIWWIGMLINAVGEVGNLVAYGYAEATVVTPIGAVGVIFGAIIATFILVSCPVCRSPPMCGTDAAYGATREKSFRRQIS